MPVPLLVIMVVGVVAMVVWSQLKLRAGKAQHADKNLGAMTARMGLTIEVGDPSLNLLYFQQPAGNFERELRATGAPYGRPVKFQLRDGRATAEYVVVRKITHTFGCFLTAPMQVQVPPFEVVLRDPNQYLIPDQELADEPLVEVSTGHAALDQRYIVRAGDPRIGPALVPALEALSQQLYVHLAGRGGQLWMSFTRVGLPYLSYAPEEYLLALESAACGLEGRQAPARIPVAGAGAGIAAA